MTRTDHRQNNQLRPLALSQSLLSRSDGSAKFSLGEVLVLASVTGPTEVRIRDELVDRATLEINARPLRGVAGPSSKSLESLLRTLLTPLILLSAHPRSLIQLTVQTLSAPSTLYAKPYSTDLADHSLEDDDDRAAGRSDVGKGMAERSAGINAAVLAFLDAGVEMRGMIMAVAIAFVVSSDGGLEMRLDPTSEEEESSRSCHLFGFSFGVAVGGTEGECVLVDSVGKFDEDELFEAQDLAQEATRSILAFVRKSIERKYGVAEDEVGKDELLESGRESEDDEDEGMEE